MTTAESKTTDARDRACVLLAEAICARRLALVAGDRREAREASRVVCRALFRLHQIAHERTS